MKRNQHVLSRPKKFVGIRKILIFYFYFLPKLFATTIVSQNLQLKNFVTFGTC